MKSTLFVFALVLFILIVSGTAALNAQVWDKEPESLRDAGILVSFSLYGPTSGPYGVMQEEGYDDPLVYSGQALMFLLVIRHGGYYPFDLFPEDGDLTQLVSVRLTDEDGKDIETRLENVGSPNRTNSKGQSVTGFESLTQGESVLSCPTLLSQEHGSSAPTSRWKESRGCF